MGAIGFPSSPCLTSDIFGRTSAISSTVFTLSKIAISAGTWSKRYSRLPIKRIHQEISLEERIHRRRLGARTPQARALDDCHFRCPVSAPTHAMNGNPVLIDFWPGLEIVEHAREHALGIFTDFDWRLPCARAVHGEKSNAEGKNRREALRQIFLPAVQPVYSDHQRHWSIRILRQAQVADDFFPLERNLNDFEGRVPEACVGQKSLDRFLVRALFTGQMRDRPASEGIKPPGANVVGIRFRRVGFLERLGFIHVAISHPINAAAHSSLSRVWMELKASFTSGRVESDERIHSVLGAMNGFGLDLVKRPIGALLGERRDTHGEDEREQVIAGLDDNVSKRLTQIFDSWFA